MDDLKNKNTQEEFSLNDDRRVKVLSPGAMVAKRFFRNRLAVVGLTMLVIMFVFSFIGGVISPYGQDEQFYTYEVMNQDYAGVVENNDFRYTIADGQEFGTILQAQFLLASNNQAESFEYKDVTYDLTLEGPDFYTISSNGTILAIAAKDIINSESGEDLSFNVKLEALRAYTNGETSFTADGADYTLDEDGNIMQGSETLGYISRFVVSPIENGVTISREFKEQISEAVDQQLSEVDIVDDNGETQHFEMSYEPETGVWTIIREEETYVYDRYASPSPAALAGN